jgi:hypothetical protein
MSETIGIADRVATSASRRRLLGRIGTAALAAAVAAGVLMTVPSAAEADRPTPGVCGLQSIPECVGALEGAACGGLDASGYCLGAPNCYCFIGKGKRGRRGGH